jgi:hypothetical protein
VYGSGAAGPANKPPKLELDGKKWIVEYFKVSRRVFLSVLRIRILDPGSGSSLNPGSGMGKKSRSGSGMNVPDHISESLERIF